MKCEWPGVDGAHRGRVGDGINSAIDFEREANPKGDRFKKTMSGKFLPCKYYGNEQGIQDYGFKDTT